MESKLKKSMGAFYGITYGKKLIEFIVYEDGTIDCPTVGIKSAYRFVLKPRFVLIGEQCGHYEHRTISLGKKVGKHDDLIAKYVIGDDLLHFMGDMKTILYSEDMAYLYHINDEYAFDKDLVKGRYKRAVKKGPILTKQRKGQFNY